MFTPIAFAIVIWLAGLATGVVIGIVVEELRESRRRRDRQDELFEFDVQLNYTRGLYSQMKVIVAVVSDTEARAIDAAAALYQVYRPTNSEYSFLHAGPILAKRPLPTRQES